MQTSHAKTLLAEHEPLIGFDRVRIPIDRETIKSRRLLRMIELLEVLKAPDESRTLGSCCWTPALTQTLSCCVTAMTTNS